MSAKLLGVEHLLAHGNYRRAEIDHIGVIVHDLAEARRFLGDVLGLSLDRTAEDAQRQPRAAFYRCGGVSSELLELGYERRQWSGLGPGAQARIEPIAFRVDDLTESLDELERRGLRRSTSEPIRVGDTLNIRLDPQATDGVICQLIQK